MKPDTLADVPLLVHGLIDRLVNPLADLDLDLGDDDHLDLRSGILKGRRPAARRVVLRLFRLKKAPKEAAPAEAPAAPSTPPVVRKPKPKPAAKPAKTKAKKKTKAAGKKKR